MIGLINEILLEASAILCAIYIIIILRYSFGWLALRRFDYPSANMKVCVIIAARNESESIFACLQSLQSQDHPAEYTQFIIVDDHSDDNTLKIAQEFAARDKRFQVLTLPSEMQGKKRAIRFAIDQTNAELIMTTDADCIVPSGWISRMASFYKGSKANMVIAPVMFFNESSAIEKMQSLEMLALMAFTGGSSYFGSPVLCNGANLAYSRKCFLELGGFEGIEGNPSGDDVLLMYKIQHKMPGTVKFLADKSAIVRTKAKANLVTLLQQRRRWASKGTSGMTATAKFSAGIVYLFNIMLLLSLLLSGLTEMLYPHWPPFFRISLILTGIKCLIDFLLLFLAASFFDKKGCLLYFLPQFILYPIYIAYVSWPFSDKTYTWKGRKIKY
jgi:cellulose synthase/poly-beta-1,6-N-acetylglucosamine synthase-like glycosyltransferase